jgi:hypothetical protein
MIKKQSSFIIFLLLLGGMSVAEEPRPELPPLHHPVSIPVPVRMQLPQDFVLDKQGLLQCSTCHGIKNIAEIPFSKVDTNAENFLNGGYYKKLTDFCYRCHEKKSNQRLFIHKMLDSRQQIDKSNCTFCHQKILDPDNPPKLMQFRLPMEKLCWGCHLKTPHLNALTHSQQVSDEMRQIIAASEQKYQVILPLDKQGRIMCVTCHTAHEQGVLDSQSYSGRQVADTHLEEGVSYRDSYWNRVYQADKHKRLQELAKQTGKTLTLNYQKLEKEVLLRLPAKNGILCRACHRFKD